MEKDKLILLTYSQILTLERLFSGEEIEIIINLKNN